VKKRLNDSNYVLQKSAKSKLFVVHVDRMQKYQSETSDNSCTVVEHHLLSDNSMKPPGQKPDTPTIINGGDDISHQSVKSNTAVRPADLIVSTNSAGVITPLAMAMATATVDRPTGMLDWISDTGTAGADQYSTSESDTSKTPAQPANSNTANTRARDCVTVVVSNGPHPLRPIRPLRTRLHWLGTLAKFSRENTRSTTTHILLLIDRHCVRIKTFGVIVHLQVCGMYRVSKWHHIVMGRNRHPRRQHHCRLQRLKSRHHRRSHLERCALASAGFAVDGWRPLHGKR